MENTIDRKIKQLNQITDKFLFIEDYSHTGCKMFKINNEFTSFAAHTIVLCSLDEGIEKALDLAIEAILKCKKEFNH